jgi:2-polyprenyl-6-hydroxyphenyl methylase/3-demethylubiquinone-9 3-methyltransferase
MNRALRKQEINNRFYDELGERWYADDEHIIALLRVESKAKLTYVQTILNEHGLKPGARILDVGCGAGFLSNSLAAEGWDVSGIDQSEGSIRVALRHAPQTASPQYQWGDAYHLPYPKKQFDAVLMMDFLEHVDDPARALAEASRVVKDDGLIIFYTFNRTRIAQLLAIKAVEWLARDCPKNFHVWKNFIKPQELRSMFQGLGFDMSPLQGLRPRFLHRPFWSTVWQRRIHPDFQFQYTSDLNLGYLGYAKRNGTSAED